jgi:hypothetical protein
MQVVGSMKAAIKLYESCIVSSLLTNSGTWTEITKSEIKLLDECQDTFCRALLQVPGSTPKASLRAAFGLADMDHRVKEAKILLVKAIRTQEEGQLVREVLEEQLAMGFPGLGQEVRELCRELGLPDATTMEIEKEEIKEAIQISNLAKLKADMQGKVKLEELSQTDVRQAQEYVNWSVEECRMGFRLQTKMLDCRSNMPRRYKRDLACRACPPNPATGLAGQEEETQDHLEVCRGYSDLWQGLGPLTPLSRVKYFIKLKNRRSKEQSKEQSKE